MSTPPAPLLPSPKPWGPLAHARAVTVTALFAVLLVLVVAGYRMWFRQQGETLSTSVTQDARASFACALPVITTAMSGNLGAVIKVSPGFVNFPSGEFRADPAAMRQDLPSDKSGLSATYSSSLKRWLPADSRTVSPDGRSFVYVKWLPDDRNYSIKGVTATSYELHLVDAAKKTDRKLWSTTDAIGIDRWDSHEILVDTYPNGGGPRLWRIDPATGRVVSQGQSGVEEPSLPADALPGSGIMYMIVGQDAQRRAVFRIGARDPGTKYRIVVVESGRATTIYSGVAGDATDFDPGGAYSDTHGLWMGNDDGSRVWLWTRSTGLQSFNVTGLPPAPSGFDLYNVSLGPAGECVPGQFDGVALTPLPPPATPTTSAIPSPS